MKLYDTIHTIDMNWCREHPTEITGPNDHVNKAIQK